MSARPELRLVEAASSSAPSESGAAESPPHTASVLVACGLVIAALASFPLDGFYDMTRWGPLGLVAICFVVLLVLTRRLTLPRLAVACVTAFAALTVWTGLSALWAPGLDRAWTEFNRSATYFVLLVLVLLAVRTERPARAAITLLTAGAGALTLLMTATFALHHGVSWFQGNRLNEPTAYINGSATVLSMSVWLLIGWADRTRSAIASGAAIALAGMALDLAVMTQSRVTMLALAASALVAIGLGPDRLRRLFAVIATCAGAIAALPWVLEPYAERRPDFGLPHPASLQAAGVAMLVCGASVGVLWVIASRIARDRRQRARQVGVVAAVALGVAGLVGAAVAVGDPSDEVSHAWRSFHNLRIQDNSSRFLDAGGYRYDLWRIAWSAFEDEPLHGIGAGNYASVFLEERRTPQYVRQPHSVESQALCELGLVGAGLLVAAFACVGLAAAAVQRARGGGWTELPTLAAVAVSWLVVASVDWAHLLVGPTLIAILCTGIVLARCPDPAPVGVGARAGQPLRVLALLAVAVVLATSLGRQLAAKLYVHDAQEALAVHPAKAFEPARRALGLDSHDPDAWYALAAAYARRNEYERARRALLAAADAERFNYVPWVLLGDLATRRGDAPAAARSYARARALDPHRGAHAP